MVYRVDAPISWWRVFSFCCVTGKAQLDFAVSSDGKNYQPVAAGRRAFASGQTVYGYLTPVLFEGDSGANEARYLRIAMQRIAERQGAATKSEEVPLEIGRVEIEYDREPIQVGRPGREAIGRARAGQCGDLCR